MEFNYNYKGNTTVNESSANTQMSFSPDTLRQPTYFIGEVRQNVAFREAISALHNVVVSDMRFKPKDKTAYKEWAANQQNLDIELLIAQSVEVKNRLNKLQEELKQLNHLSYERRAPFYDAQRHYFNYLYQKDRDAWFVLDPVITVHPDEVFFECFSQDESSYGRLSASYEIFKNISESTPPALKSKLPTKPIIKKSKLIYRTVG